MEHSHLPAAKWYVDPAHPKRARYWDGTAWTGRTRRKDEMALCVGGIGFTIGLVAMASQMSQAGAADPASGAIDFLMSAFFGFLIYGLLPYGIAYAITVKQFPLGGAAAPGWYDDAAAPGTQRYWDGRAWTSGTREGSPTP